MTTEMEVYDRDDAPMRGDILRRIRNGEIHSERAVEDMAAERKKWTATGLKADAQVASAYAALEEGRQLVDLSKVVAQGGRSHLGLPNIALAPVGMPNVTCRYTNQAVAIYRRSSRLPRWVVNNTPHWSMRFTFDGYASGARWVEGSTPAPLIPPEVRKIVKPGNLLVWEAEWQKVTRAFQMPEIHLDPALLEHVVGSLYMVKAAWDLTELEVAALR